MALPWEVLGWAAAVAQVAVAVLVVRWLIDYVAFRRVELAIPGPPSLPILGNTLDLVNVTPQTVFPTIMKLWGGRTELSRVSILNKLIVFVSDPDDIEALMRRKDLVDKARFFYEFIEVATPKGLVVINGADHKRHRAATQPAFHRELLDTYQDIFVEEAEKYVKQIKPFEELDVYVNLSPTVARNFIRTEMSSELTAESEQFLLGVLRFIQFFTKVLNARSMKPWLRPEWLFNLTSISKRVKKDIEFVHNFTGDLMNKRRETLKEEDSDDSKAGRVLKPRKTLMDVLLDGQVDEKFHLTEQESLDEVLMFIAAALDSTITTISFAFKALSLQPEIQERAYAEVMEVLGDSKRSVTLDDLPKMTYLENVIKETFRMFPAIPFIARQVHAETEFSGKVLPKDTTLVVNIFGVHRDARYWSEPSRFNPDRFSVEAENEGKPKHPYCYIPFSAGSRNCIGSHFASRFVKTMLATVLRDFRIDRANDGVGAPSDMPLTFSVVMSVYGGTKVTFTPRKAETPKPH